MCQQALQSDLVNNWKTATELDVIFVEFMSRIYLCRAVVTDRLPLLDAVWRKPRRAAVGMLTGYAEWPFQLLKGKLLMRTAESA